MTVFLSKAKKKRTKKPLTFQLPRLRVPAGKGEEDHAGAEGDHRGVGGGGRGNLCAWRGGGGAS